VEARIYNGAAGTEGFSARHSPTVVRRFTLKTSMWTIPAIVTHNKIVVYATAAAGKGWLMTKSIPDDAECEPNFQIGSDSRDLVFEK
jgi:hypothetical protein